MGATDSKLALRKSAFRLFEERNIPATADDFWTLFWNVPESNDDVFSLIGASDIRRIRDSARENMGTLFDKAMDRIDTIVNTPSKALDQDAIKQLLNACRILARILPFVFESTDCAEWEDAFFWAPYQAISTPEEQASQPAEATEARPQPHRSPFRGEHLLNLTIQCMFLAGFTLPSSLASKDTLFVPTVWEKGVGSSESPASSKEIEAHRTEILNLLLVLLSKSMYILPAKLLDEEDKWLAHVVGNIDKKTVQVILCSLLNTACCYDPVGWGVPYNYVLGDPREELTLSCLRVLLILLDYQSPRETTLMRQREKQPVETVKNADITSASVERRTTNDTETDTVENANSAFTLSDTIAYDNTFKHFLSKLHRPKDFAFLKDGVYRILKNPVQANNTYLPRSTKRVNCHTEMLMLSWRLLETNARFRTYLMDKGQALELMTIILCYATESKRDRSREGLVRTCAFMLQTLSSDRAFAVSLNTPFADPHLPTFYGSYADFLITSICNLITTTEGQLASLYYPLVLTITNTSPYFKRLSITTANKLLALFKATSSPGFLLAKEGNHVLAIFLLEAFNNLIQYQFSENTHLVYALVRDHHYFYKLRDLTLSSAQAEIEQKKQRKAEAQVANANAAPTSSAPHPSHESGQEISAEPVMEQQEVQGEMPEGQKEAGGEVEQTQDQQRTESEVSADQTDSVSMLPASISEITVFVPTEAWMTQWHNQLPLYAILVLLNELVPKVEDKCSKESLTEDKPVLEYLRGTTLTGLLPVPAPIFVRTFYWSEAVAIWFRSMFWGQTYMSSAYKHYVWSGAQNMSAFKLAPWNGTQVKLFQIMPSP